MELYYVQRCGGCDVAVLSYILNYSICLLFVFGEYVQYALHFALIACSRLDCAVDARTDTDVRRDAGSTLSVHGSVAVCDGLGDVSP